MGAARRVAETAFSVLRNFAVTFAPQTFAVPPPSATLEQPTVR